MLHRASRFCFNGWVSWLWSHIENTGFYEIKLYQHTIYMLIKAFLWGTSCRIWFRNQQKCDQAVGNWWLHMLAVILQLTSGFYEKLNKNSQDISNDYTLKTWWLAVGFRKSMGLASKGKGKAVPLQAWSGSGGSRNLRFPDYMTTARVVVRLSALRTGHL